MVIKITKKTKPRHVKKSRFWSVTGGCIQRPPIEVAKRKLETLPAKAGFFVPQEKYAVQDYFEQLPLKQAERAEHREAVHRLVKDSKSPTSIEDVIQREKNRFAFNFLAENRKHIEFEENAIQEVQPQKQITPHGVVGCSTVVQYREWAQEYRVRTQVDTTSGVLPPPQEGERISDMLSERAAKKIAESCEFMSLKKGGYKTFATATFKPEVRARIKAGETSIQKEVSRCMDAMQKMYQRGWVTESGKKIEGITPIYVTEKNRQGQDVEKLTNGLSYCWVVEIPINENYEENPHVHLLLGWGVPWGLFADWSKRIESIWGNGTMHLEKIKDCASAGAYMAKAAGYMTKAQGDATQGVVRGNRYGISEPARAPDWVTVGKSQLHVMGQIIADVYDHLTITHGAKYRERKTLNDQLAATPKTDKIARHAIGEKLQAVRAKIKEIPIRCNKYQVILKGQAVAGLFFSWAKGEKVQRPDWLPELPKELAWDEGVMPTPHDTHGFKLLREKFAYMKKRFLERKILRQAGLNTYEFLSGIVEKVERFRDEAFSGWFEYENLDLCQ